MFVSALEDWHCPSMMQSVLSLASTWAATNTKFGLVSSQGELLLPIRDVDSLERKGARRFSSIWGSAVSTCRAEAEDRGLELDAIGLATAGWAWIQLPVEVVLRHRGIYLAGPGRIGCLLAGTHLACPLQWENDANALAVAEKRFGAAKNATDFVCITLGTGGGGGCLHWRQGFNRGRHFFANALGHIPVVARRGALHFAASQDAWNRMPTPSALMPLRR